MDVEKDNFTLQVTHPEVFNALGMSAVDFKRDFPKAPIGTKFITVVNNSALYETVWEPLTKCALDWKCIAPYGSEHDDVEPNGPSHTHRYEYSVLTLLLYRTFKNDWLPKNDTQEMIQRMYNLVDPDFMHDYLWAHYCNPPQNEVNCLENEKKCS